MRSLVLLLVAALGSLPADGAAQNRKKNPKPDDDFVPATLPLAPSNGTAKKKGPDSAPVEELHPAPSTAPEPEAGYRVIEAYADAERPAEVAAGLKEQRRPELKRLRLAPRIGAVIPRTELGAGLLAGAEVSYLLPVLSDGLRLGLGAGYSFTGFKGPRLDPQRGIDPAALQNTTAIPVEALLSWSPRAAGEPFEFAVGAGYGLYVIHTAVAALGQTAEQTTAGSALLLAVRGGYRLGPGVLLAEVRHAEVAVTLDALPSTTQETFSGTALTVGFGLEL